MILKNKNLRVKINPVNYDWYHLAFVYGDDSLLIYYNGNRVQVEETVQTGSYGNGDGKMVIGRQFTNRDEKYVSMHLDEVMMWNQSLDADEINNLYKKYNGYSNQL